jgi:putrescine transport system permease protein
MRRLTLIAIPYLWLLALFLVPFLIVMKISLSEYALSIPPYSPYLDLSAGWAGLLKFLSQLDLENYIFLTTDDLYWKAYLSSLKIATLSTVITLLVGFPLAYGMARAATEWRPTLLMLVILPFWTSFLIRVYAWMGLLSQEGLINQLAALAGGDKRAFDDPEHPNGGLYRYRLYLSTIYGFAHLFNIGKA